jgi:hypothetical protein
MISTDRRKSCKSLHSWQCGDAGGTLRGFATRLVVQSTRAFFASPSRCLSSCLERVCSRGEGSRGPWGLTGYTSLQNRLYTHLGQADRASGSRRRAKLLTTPPQLVSFRRSSGRGCGGKKQCPILWQDPTGEARVSSVFTLPAKAGPDGPS